MKPKKELMHRPDLQESVNFNATYYHCVNADCGQRFIAHRFQAQCPTCRDKRATEVISA
jgi:Zn finger protein HypA/HybF involved in hydrogenase expression